MNKEEIDEMRRDIAELREKVDFFFSEFNCAAMQDGEMSTRIYQKYEASREHQQKLHDVLEKQTRKLDRWCSMRGKELLAEDMVPQLCFRVLVLFMCGATFLSYRETYSGSYCSHWLPKWCAYAAIFGGEMYSSVKATVFKYNDGVELTHDKRYWVSKIKNK